MAIGDLTAEDGTRVIAGIRVCLMAGAGNRSGCRLAVTRSGLTVSLHLDSAEPADDGEWSAKEHITLLGAMRPGDPFRQLGVYASM